MSTGSTIIGLNQGMAHGLGGSGTGGDIGGIINVLGNPSGIVTVGVTSGVAWDGENSQHYMGLTGQSWVKLGSVA